MAQAPIEFSEERAMLLETAMDFCANRSPVNVVRKRLDDGAGFDAALWKEMTDLGWLAIAIPEACGGLGLSLGDVAPVAESMGRHLLASPFHATTVAAQAVLGSGGEAQKQQYLAEIAGGAVATTALIEEDGAWDLLQVAATGTMGGDSVTLAGTKTFVLDADVAELIVASVCIDGTVRLVVIDKAAIDPAAIVQDVVIDQTRRSFTVSLDGVTVPAGAILEQTNFAAIERAELLLLAADIAGGSAGVLNVIIDYLNTRKQFDRLIGSYQALKHPTVDILLDMEAARSHLYHAATVLDGDDDQAIETALRMAKAHGSASFAHAGDRAVQFHGGFGFTWECDAQLYLRRALWCQYQYGDEKYHRQLLAALVLDAA